MSDEYDRGPRRPNHAEAYALAIVALGLTVASILLLNSDTASATSIQVGVALLIAGILGLFVSMVAVVIVNAIYTYRR